MSAIKYELSEHAKLRYKQRVGKGNGKAWVNHAIKNSIPLETDCYRYGDYKIVVKGNVVVTISYHNDQQIKDFKHDVIKMLVNKFNRKLRPLEKQKKEIQITVYEAKIRQLRARNPKVRESIQRDIEALEKDLNAISTEVNDVLKVANKYHITRGDLL